MRRRMRLATMRRVRRLGLAIITFIAKEGAVHTTVSLSVTWHGATQRPVWEAQFPPGRCLVSR